MTLTLVNGTPLQKKIVEAFSNRHGSTLDTFEITITLMAERLEKVEGFSISAKRNQHVV